MRLNKQSKIVAVLSVIAVVAILFMTPFGSNIFILGTNDYDTGLPISTITTIDSIKKSGDNPSPNAVFIQQPTVKPEIFTHDKYICSWLPREYSQLITMRCDFDYTNLWSTPMLGTSQEGATLSRYYFTVNYTDARTKQTVTVIDTSKGTEPGKAWNTQYVEMDTNRWTTTKTRFALDSTGFGGLFLPTTDYSDINFVKNDPIKKWREEDEGNRPWHILSTDTIEFHMKGMRLGILEVNYFIEWCERKDNWIGNEWRYKGWSHLATDKCYLASGQGDINILSTNSITTDGTATEQLTDASGTVTSGDTYTKYVYEEGATIDIRLTTGYSGSSLEKGEDGYGAGWTCIIYDGAGTPVKIYENIPDNRDGYSLVNHPLGVFKVPVGAFKPGGINEWKVVLKNTLFKQAETEIFVVDDLDKIPLKTTVSLDKQKYVEGDTVTVTLSAMGNPLGTGEITKFWVVAKWGGASSTYILDGFPKYYSAIKGTGGIYTTRFSFELPTERPVTLETLYVRAHAMDRDDRAGVEGEKYPYVEQNNTLPFIPIPTDDVILIIIILIVVIAVGIATYFVLRKKGKLPKIKVLPKLKKVKRK
jgi:hypothetical protein